MKAPALESVFLNRSPIPQTRDFARVLILGGDATGVAVAERLMRAGYDAVMLDFPDDFSPCPPGSAMGKTELEEVHGFVGCFDAVFNLAGQRRNERFGFIVAAQPGEIVPKFSDYGLEPTDKVVSLCKLEELLSGDCIVGNPDEQCVHAAFLCGLKGDANPALFERVFDAVQALRKRFAVQSYVFTRDVKVAAAGLERRYRQIREQGTLFFKFDDKGPVFEYATEDVKIVFSDPVLNVEMELVPDLMVVDEHQRPPLSLSPLLDIIPSCQVTAPFLQPESTRFSGVQTPKAGIFAVGASRGNFSAKSAARESEAVLVAVKTAQTGEVLAHLPGPPVVDPAKCTICLTCIRLCPHGAMSFQKRAEADPASCVRCGICAAECPMEAIRLEAPMGRITSALDTSQDRVSDDSAPRIVAFLCSRSAARALKSAGAKIRARLLPAILPCAGTLDLSRVIAAFQEGAEGVLVGTCHIGNCASIYGNVLAAERLSRVREVLQEAGIDPARLSLVTLASNTPGDLARAVLNLEETMLKLSPYGLTSESEVKRRVSQ